MKNVKKALLKRLMKEFAGSSYLALISATISGLPTLVRMPAT